MMTIVGRQRGAWAWVVLGVSLIAAPAVAQDVPFSPAETEACLAQAEDRAGQTACIGVSASACYGASEGSNVEYGLCFGAAHSYWDARLNAAYGALMAQHAAMDAEMAELGSAVPPMAPALQEMQRAWIPYRDAACTHEALTWGGGSGSGPAWAECMMQVTGAQALWLESYLEEMDGG